MISALTTLRYRLYSTFVEQYRVYLLSLPGSILFSPHQTRPEAQMLAKIGSLTVLLTVIAYHTRLMLCKLIGTTCRNRIELLCKLRI